MVGFLFSFVLAVRVSFLLQMKLSSVMMKDSETESDDGETIHSIGVNMWMLHQTVSSEDVPDTGEFGKLALITLVFMMRELY